VATPDSGAREIVATSASGSGNPVWVNAAVRSRTLRRAT